ncbi:MAG: universal stress protein UspE [Gammaproteobacteria bacterium]|nr:universal stress protein UspE [Gammaproteobacteria bacterium]
MQIPKKILVIITREQANQPALERALRFADNCSIEITLFSAVYEPALELTAVLAPDERRQFKQQYLEARRSYLLSLIEQHSDDSISIKCQVAWHKKPAHAAVQYFQNNAFDLVIKKVSSDSNTHNPFVMPGDWHLLRFCPSPLLLVKDNKWHTKSAILGAISSTSEDTEHQQLNHKVIEYTQYLAELTGGEAHVVNSHVSPTMDAPIELPSIDIKGLREKVSALHMEKTQSIVAAHPFCEHHIHVVEGLAEEKIPLTAQRVNAQIVVMGTVGRTGLTAAFMGNTAERVLAKLPCEVLALKPDNFEI